jgi:hypothetical protein
MASNRLVVAVPSIGNTLLTVSPQHCAVFDSNGAQSMASFTLGTASQATGTAKSTILRAIKAGRISASRDELGQWVIDPAELARVFPLLTVPGATPAPQEIERRATQIERDATTDLLVAELRAALAGLRQDRDDLRQDRDRWHAAYENEQAAHARTQEALSTTQRLLPPPTTPSAEHGATATERDATPVGEGLERGATPMGRGNSASSRSEIRQPDLPPLGIQRIPEKPRSRSWLPWRRSA